MLAIFIASGFALAFGGCSSKASPDDFTQVDVDRVASKCGVPGDRILLNQGAVVISQPSENDVAEACVLRELKSTGKTKITMVGNALHSRDSK